MSAIVEVQLEPQIQFEGASITFVGTKGEIEENPRKRKRYSSFVLSYKDKRYMFEFGADKTQEDLDKHKPDWLIISHSHPDHAYGLLKVDPKIPVAMTSETYEILNKKKDFKLAEQDVKVLPRLGYIGDLLVRTVPVPHSIKAPSVAFVLNVGKKILYSSDLAYIPKPTLKDIWLYIGDGSYLTKGNIRKVNDTIIGHAPVAQQMKWLQDAGVKNAIFTHFGKWIIGENLNRVFFKLSKDYDINTHAAFDGRTFNLSRQRLEGLPGIYLKPPHARLIWEGSKTLIVKSKRFDKYIDKPIYFIEDQKVFGILKLKSVKGPYNAELVKYRMRERHRISDEEWEEWWPGVKEVYIYELDLIKKFDKPVYYEPSPGTQVFIKEVELPRVEEGGPPLAEVKPPQRTKQAQLDRTNYQTTTPQLISRDNYPVFMKEFDIDTADPSKFTRAVLLHHHAKTHAWWHRAKEGKSKFTKEQILRYHQRIVKDMLRRNIHHHIVEDLDTKAKLEQELADVAPSGVEIGEVMTLDEVLNVLKPFYLKRPFVSLVGGLVIHGKTKGDADYLIDFPKRVPDRDIPLEFRIGRAMATKSKLNGRFSFHYMEYGGSFTSYYPVYDLMCVPSALRGIIKMERLVEWIREELALSELKDKDAAAQADRARRQDKVGPLQFVMAQKPQIGHLPGERYSLEDLVALIPQEAYPVVVEPKYDGNIIVIMKEGDKVICRLEGGQEVTRMLPGTVEEVKKMPIHAFTIHSDTELWRGKKYIGREFVATYLVSKQKPNDQGFVHNVVDIAYFYDEKLKVPNEDSKRGDVHNLPYSRRRAYLVSLPIKQSTMGIPSTDTHFNVAPSKMVENAKEVVRLGKMISQQPAKEGIIVKSLRSVFSLTGANYKWWKYKKTSDLRAIVLKVLPTKKAGLYRYRVGLRIPQGWTASRVGQVDDRKFMDIGKTMNLAKRLSEGTIVTVNFEELFYYRDPETNEVQLIVYVPNIVEVHSELKEPEDAQEAIVNADKAGTLRKKLEALSYVRKERGIHW